MSLFKQEIICDSCDRHFILVTKIEEDCTYCPFCSEEISFIGDMDSDEI